MFASTRDKAETAEDNMINEGARTVQDVKETARRFKNDAKDTAHAMKDDLEDIARRTGRQVRDFADSASHNVTDVADSVAGKIRNNPVQSSFVALGIGFVVGMLFRRR